MATVEEQAKLNEFMRKGWSYPLPGGVSVTSEYITDASTGKRYRLSVVNGKLTMSEVTE